MVIWWNAFSGTLCQCVALRFIQLPMKEASGGIGDPMTLLIDSDQMVTLLQLQQNGFTAIMTLYIVRVADIRQVVLTAVDQQRGYFYLWHHFFGCAGNTQQFA